MVAARRSTSRNRMPKDDKPTTGREEITSFAKDEILGARHWRESKIGSLTGYAPLRDGLKAPFRLAGDSMGRISTLSRLAFRKDTSGVAVDPAIVDTRQRFLEAMAANGRSLADVDRSVNVTYAQFWVYAALVAVTLAVGLGLVWYGGLRPTGSTFLDVPLFFVRFLPLPLLTALLLRAGWTNWSFRRRRLDGIRNYLRAGRSMLPRKATPRTGPVKTRSVPRPANDTSPRKP